MLLECFAKRSFVETLFFLRRRETNGIEPKDYVSGENLYRRTDREASVTSKERREKPLREHSMAVRCSPISVCIARSLH